ncbi:MAG: diguanylate cyclase, partial [Campylobacterota bacterium]|nr:diguanylate cyclase [Campylobacterota bacterium]
MKDRVFPKPIGVVMVKDDNKFIELIEKLSNIAVQGYDKERNVIYWNKTSELLYGYTKAEALGKKLEDLIIPEPMRDAVTQGISNWDENGVPASQLELQHKDGSAITVYSSHVMLYEDTNEPEMFCLDIDISKQKRQESELAFVNERMELALLGNSDGVWDWNILTNDIYYAPRWKEMLGYRDDELPNAFHVWEEKMHKEDVAGTLEDVQTHLSGQSEFMDSTLRLQCKDESWIWVRCRAKAIFDKDANPVRMIGTNTDITKEKNIEQQLIKQAQIIEQVHDSVISTDIQGNILTWNSGSESMLGYTAQEVVGKNMSILHRVDDIVKNQEYAKELLHKESFSVDAYLVSKDKREIPVLVSLSLLKDERGNPIGLIGVSQDITERKRIEEELATQKEILSHQAHHDFLTGLPNRLLFHDRLEYAIKEAQRHKTKVALLFIDLDHFKEINDSLGHGIGDQVLQEITLRLRHSIRDEDSIARLGGDEFTVILKNIEHAQDASLVAEKLLKTLSETIESIGSENRLYISSSIGISIYPDDGADSQSLLKFADSAMYRAKDEGRNNYQYYSSEMTELAFERVVMETALRAAIEKEEFVVYYQPQVNAIENRVVGMEALVRWMHPTMGMISPAKFIPLAE